MLPGQPCHTTYIQCQVYKEIITASSSNWKPIKKYAHIYSITTYNFRITKIKNERWVWLSYACQLYLNISAMWEHWIRIGSLQWKGKKYAECEQNSSLKLSAKLRWMCGCVSSDYYTTIQISSTDCSQPSPSNTGDLQGEAISHEAKLQQSHKDYSRFKVFLTQWGTEEAIQILQHWNTLLTHVSNIHLSKRWKIYGGMLCFKKLYCHSPDTVSHRTLLICTAQKDLHWTLSCK